MQATHNSERQQNCGADYSHTPVLEPRSLNVSGTSHPALGTDDQQPRHSHTPVLEPRSLNVSGTSHPALGTDDQQPRHSHTPVLEPRSLNISGTSHPALGTDDQQPRPHTKENLNAETAVRLDEPPRSFAQGNAERGVGITTTKPSSKGNPLFIEICAGTAMLSRCFKEAGFDAVAIDHSKNRFHPLAHICNIDLTTTHGWQFLDHLIDHYNVVFVHAAPPCGTCSRAREIKLAGWCPQPLRTEAEPAGISTLQGDDLERVTSANEIYSGLCNFLQKCSRLNIHWSVENPARSLLWCTPWFQPVIQMATFYNYDACAWGSKRKTDKSFLSTLPQMCQI